MVASFAAILNPDTCIFSKEEVDDILLEKIAGRCEAYFPKEHVPKLAISDWKEDYLLGLQKLGINLMIAASGGSAEKEEGDG